MKMRHFAIWAVLVALVATVVMAGPNELTKEEKEQGWKLLWDGKSFEGWKSPRGEGFPEGCWEIVDGTLTLVEREKRPKKMNADIVTVDTYSNFELSLQFRTNTENTNSGVKIFVLPNTSLGLEYQIFVTDKPANGPHNTGDLYDLFYALDNSSNPRGEWNTVKIVSRDKKVEHWLNGKKILEYVRGDADFMAAKENSKFRDNEKWGLADSGHILLQDHPGSVSFRNIKIKEL